MVSNQPSMNPIDDKDKKTLADKPGELAVIAYNYLKESAGFKDRKDIFILDLGCGYGRDAVFLALNLPCHILGLDNSKEVIEVARRSLGSDLEKKIELLCYDFSSVSDKYDVIFVSNLYHLLDKDDMANLRETVKRCLKSDGIVFLSAPSVRAPRSPAKNAIVPGQTSFYPDVRNIHLFTREEMEKDFEFLNISALYERENFQSQSVPAVNQVSWILIGRLK